VQKVLVECKPASRRDYGPGETFWYFHEMYIFDVDKANELVCDGREPVELDEQSVRMSLAERAELNPEHVARVDPSRPGIIAHVQYRTENGELFKGHVLIDGNHRAARCLELERPFLAYLLTEAESRAILLRSPDLKLPG
jgi:hypothetical protein